MFFCGRICTCTYNVWTEHSWNFRHTFLRRLFILNNALERCPYLSRINFFLMLERSHSPKPFLENANSRPSSRVIFFKTAFKTHPHSSILHTHCIYHINNKEIIGYWTTHYSEIILLNSHTDLRRHIKNSCFVFHQRFQTPRNSKSSPTCRRSFTSF